MRSHDVRTIIWASYCSVLATLLSAGIGASCIKERYMTACEHRCYPQGYEMVLDVCECQDAEPVCEGKDE